MTTISSLEISIPRGEIVDTRAKNFFEKDIGLLHIAYAIFPSLFPKFTNAKLIAKDALHQETNNPNIKLVQELCKKLGYDKELNIYEGRKFKTHGGSFSFSPHVLILPDKNLTHIDELLLAKQIVQLKSAKGLKSLFWTAFQVILNPPLSSLLFLANPSIKTCCYLAPVCIAISCIFTIYVDTPIFNKTLAASPNQAEKELAKQVRFAGQIIGTISSFLFITIYGIRRDTFENDYLAAKLIGFDKAIKALKDMKVQAHMDADQSCLSILSVFAFEWSHNKYDPNRFVGPTLNKRINHLQTIQKKEIKV